MRRLLHAAAMRHDHGQMSVPVPVSGFAGGRTPSGAGAASDGSMTTSHGTGVTAADVEPGVVGAAAAGRPSKGAVKEPASAQVLVLPTYYT